MAKFVVKYHFDREHLIRQVIEAESMSDARSRIAESIRGDDHFRIFEVRAADSLYLIPVQSVRFIQIVEAEKETGHQQWHLD